MIRPELDRRVLAFLSAGLLIERLLDITGFQRRGFLQIISINHSFRFGDLLAESTLLPFSPNPKILWFCSFCELIDGAH